MPVDTNKKLESLVDRLEDMLRKQNPTPDVWNGPLRREMAKVGVVQGEDGLPRIHYDKQGKTVTGIQQESLQLRFQELSTRHTNLKAETAGLRSELAHALLEIQTLKQGRSVHGDVFDAEAVDAEILEIGNR